MDKVNVFCMTGPGMVGNRARILIIKDIPGTRLAVRTPLEDTGHAIDGAATGSEGVLEFHKGPPQADEIVILDLRLPDMPGEHVLATLKALPRISGIPVIVVSAKAREEDSASARSFGAADYVKTLWSEGTVENAVQRALSGLAQRKPGAACTRAAGRRAARIRDSLRGLCQADRAPEAPVPGSER